MRPLLFICFIVFFQYTIISTAQEKNNSKNLLQISGVVTDSLTNQTLSNTKIVLYDVDKENYVKLQKEFDIIQQNTKLHLIDVVSTNDAGYYQVDAVFNKHYLLIVTINGFISETRLFSTFNNEINNTKFNFNLQNQEVYMDSDKRFLVKINPIKFEINSSKITTTSKKEINKVVMLMKKYTDFEVEIGVHSSSLGGDAFNVKLSEKRASQISDYIKSFNWPDKDRLTAVGYGETKLINECVNGVKCTSKKHLENKRVEFVLHNKYIPASDMEYLNRNVNIN